MTTPTNHDSGARADLGGFAWTALLGLALVIVIGLIGYLVFRGDVVPHAADRADLNAQAAQISQAPAAAPSALPNTVPVR